MTVEHVGKDFTRCRWFTSDKECVFGDFYHATVMPFAE